ncbi:MAG: circadian clock protein KaiC, partial [Candidatus Eremiobacteraeota bacterium]|nr:circadian clock protein KaiC [Candidatus Eremiobacteraeota bacterium]
MDKTSVDKLATGIPGFDHIAQGGVPRGRSSLISGTAGSAKTVFAVQFLAHGIEAGENGVFVTFEEPPADIRNNMKGFGWNLAPWEAESKWAFVDASPDEGVEQLEAGDYDLGALLARIEYAVKKVNAKRLSMDSLRALSAQYNSPTTVHREMLRVTTALKQLGLTSIITAERGDEYGPIARFGIEEFVVDNVIILRNVLEQEKRRRTVEVLKFRGADHHKGEYPFTILPRRGIEVISLSALKLTQSSTNIRATSGNEILDEMCGGGFFRDSIILASGATGTGKTLLVTEFIAGGVERGEKCLLFAFEESRGQLFRNADGWNCDFEQFEKSGLLKVCCVYPEVAGLEDHLIAMRKTIEEYQPDRIAVDSLSALERVASPRGFREFVIALTSDVKHSQTMGL